MTDSQILQFQVTFVIYNFFTAPQEKNLAAQFNKSKQLKITNNYGPILSRHLKN